MSTISSDVQVYCQIAKSDLQQDELCIWLDAEQNIKTRQPQLPTASDSVERKYAFQQSFDSGNPLSDIYSSLGQQVQQIVIDGLNTTIIAYGQSHTGKTTSLFGKGNNLTLDDLETKSNILEQINDEFGLCGRLLDGLYSFIDDHIPATSSNLWTVGISCWEIAGDWTQDLLEQHTISTDSPFAHQVVTIRAHTVQAACNILRSARKRSRNWRWDSECIYHALPNRCHAFFRLVLHNSKTKQASTLHLVDLGGAESPSRSSLISASQKLEHQVLERDILSFNIVIAELASIGDDLQLSDEWRTEYLQTNVLQHVEKSLMIQTLVPLLTGNNQTFFLACVNPALDCCDETVNTLRVMTRASRIKSMSFPVQNIEAQDLHLIDFVTEETRAEISQHDIDACDLYYLQHSDDSLLHMSPENRSEPGISNPDSTQDWLAEFTERKRQILQASSQEPVKPIPLFHQPLKGGSAPPVVEKADESALEKLKHAQIPTVVPPAPNVDGFEQEKAIAIKLADAELLRSNYQALLNVVKDQHRVQLQQSEQIEELRHQLQAQTLQSEIQVDSLRLKLIAANAQVRQMSKTTLHSSLFEEYEQQIDTYEQQLELLKQENIQFHCQQKSSSPKVQSLQQQLREAANKVKALEHQVAAYRKRDRLYNVNQRLVGKSTKQIHQLNKQLQVQANELLDSRFNRVQMEAVIRQQEQDYQKLQSKADELQVKYQQQYEELVGMKMFMTKQHQSKQHQHIRRNFMSQAFSNQPKAPGISSSGKLNQLIQQLLLVTKQKPSVPVEIHSLAQTIHQQLEQERLHELNLEQREKQVLQLLDAITLKQSDLEPDNPLHHIHQMALQDQIRHDLAALQ